MSEQYEYSVQSGSSRQDPWTAYTYFYIDDMKKAVDECRNLLKKAHHKDLVVVRWTITETELADPTIVYDPKKVLQ